MSRWITAEEAAELICRAKTLLGRICYRTNGEYRRSSGLLAVVQLGGVTIKLTTRADVHIEDVVAGVITFDYDSGGIKELYGSTAKNALEALRMNMVLDDLADA